MKMLTDNLTPHRRFIRHRRTSAEPGNPPKCGKNLFMQNKPNFQPNQLMLSAVIADTYNEKPLVNPKITNPIKPNTNPIGKPPKTNANFCHNKDLQRKTPLDSQNNKPNQTQIKPNTNPKTNPIFNGFRYKLYLTWGRRRVEL
jgi:hypothetical protein